MAQGVEPDDDDFASFSDRHPDPEIARLVLALDQTITACRRAAALRLIVNQKPLPLPVKPNRAELLVLTALVETFGGLLFKVEFEPVRQAIVERGAVTVFQQVLFAARDTESGAHDADNLALHYRSSEVIAVLLEHARPLFEALAERFPEIFFADARDVLDRFMPPPHARLDAGDDLPSSDEDEHDEGDDEDGGGHD